MSTICKAGVLNAVRAMILVMELVNAWMLKLTELRRLKKMKMIPREKMMGLFASRW